MEHNVCILLCFAAILLWTSHTAESCGDCCPSKRCSSGSGSGSCSDDDDSDSSISGESGGSSVYSYTVKGINGDDICLEKYSNKVLLIVNYAESCGLTEKNLVGLKNLCTKYNSKGLVVLVFPSNTFKQNPSGNEAGKKLAMEYPEFVVCSEVNVNEPCEEPLYKYLKKTTPTSCSKEIEWNFAKFLVNKQGVPVKRFGKTDEFEWRESTIAHSPRSSSLPVLNRYCHTHFRRC